MEEQVWPCCHVVVLSVWWMRILLCPNHLLAGCLCWPWKELSCTVNIGQLEICPFNSSICLEMISETRTAAMLNGFRGLACHWDKWTLSNWAHKTVYGFTIAEWKKPKSSSTHKHIGTGVNAHALHLICMTSFWLGTTGDRVFVSLCANLSA